MTSREARKNAESRIVLVADPNAVRREQIARRSGRHRMIHAASLSEVYPLAEEMGPDILAMSADFILEPEFEGLLRLADMLGSRVFLYNAAGRLTVQNPHRRHLPCVALRPGDGIDDLLSRLSGAGAQAPGDSAERRLPDLILIGASTGGIAAIQNVLEKFPADCPPTLIVQHIRDDYVAGLVSRLNIRCRPMIAEAADGETLRRGTIYIAADSDRHLVVTGKTQPRSALVSAPPRNGHRPAVDPLFESAQPWAPRVAAALLTGMGTDGAAGLGALRRAGAFTIAQDRGSSVVWGMPRAAVETGAAEVVLALDRIGPSLLAGRDTLAGSDAGDLHR